VPEITNNMTHFSFEKWLSQNGFGSADFLADNFWRRSLCHEMKVCFGCYGFARVY
jgi:hypothetical protein